MLLAALRRVAKTARYKYSVTFLLLLLLMRIMVLLTLPAYNVTTVQPRTKITIEHQ